MTIAPTRSRRTRVVLTTLCALLGVGALAACSSSAGVDVVPNVDPSDAVLLTPDPTDLPMVTIAGTFAYGQDGGQGCAYVMSGGHRYNIVLFDEQTLAGKDGVGYLVLKPDENANLVPSPALAQRADIIGVGEKLTVTGQKWLPEHIVDTICRPFDAQISATEPIKAG